MGLCEYCGELLKDMTAWGGDVELATTDGTTQRASDSSVTLLFVCLQFDLLVQIVDQKLDKVRLQRKRTAVSVS